MSEVKALLYSASEPTVSQKDGLSSFLQKKYHQAIELEWIKTPDLDKGFQLKVGNEIYDWSPEGILRQLESAVDRTDLQSSEVIPVLQSALSSWQPQAASEETGTVITVGDGIAKISGIPGAAYGEILLFDEGIRGMVLSLTDTEAGCVLFDSDEVITAGSVVRRSGRTAGVPVGGGYLGRVVNPLGVALDGKGDIIPEDYYPIEHAAPGIIDRSPVDTPLETGILAIDSMFPIGRGQRELIIGDRQTGKTTIAADTIINQKGKNCICIYVAIGQKASSIAQLAEHLRQEGAMEYSIIVAATASDADPLLYIAPYAGCSLAEFYMNQGKDVLIVYDDLSKHAVAYRALSLLLDRPPGREAYPGDVFYLHSRLLERSAHLHARKGGGSITALPIVETQAGDVSAYIPTNIISITDGQIFLESNLFFAGQRPAVNVGLSVSRVGGDAQTKAVKKAGGTLRLDLAQYREMEVFNQFASDLDEDTRKQLSYGQGLMRMLRQGQNRPYSHLDQVIILASALAHSIDDIPVDDINEFLYKVIENVRRDCANVCANIKTTKNLSDADREAIVKKAKETREQWLMQKQSQTI